MKINSNTITIDEKAHKEIEEVLMKVAEEHGIINVREAQIILDPSKGIVSFKVASDEEIDQLISDMAARTPVQVLPLLDTFRGLEEGSSG